MIAEALGRIFNWGDVRPDDPQRYMRYLPVPQLPTNLQFTMDTALQLSVVWACVDAIAKAIASSYWHVYEMNGPRRNFLPDDPLDYVLNVRPNPEMTAIGFRECLLYSALTWGNGYAEIVKDRAGRVAELWPLLPERMIPRRLNDDAATLEYHYFTLLGEHVTLRPEQVYHIKGPSITGLMGENIVARAAKSIALAIASERFALSYYGNDTVVGGTLEYPGKLSPEAHKRLKEEWQEVRQGPDKAHKPLILEGGMKFTQPFIDATKTQMVESRSFQIEEICRWYGVPPHKVQHLARATFNNIEHLGLEFTRDALTPWTRRLEQEGDFKLFSARSRPRRTHIDTAWLSQGDAQSRSAAALSWRQAGVKTANEIRHEEGMNPLPGKEGDMLLVGSGMQTMDNLLAPKGQGEGKEGGAPAQLDSEAVSPDTALNGAQVVALRQLLLDGATKQLPRESVVQAITSSFPLSREEADKVVGEVGRSFFVEAPEPAPASPPEAEPKEGEEPDEEAEPEEKAPPPPPKSSAKTHVVREALVLMFSSTLERYTRRLENRKADLERGKASANRIESHLCEERERLRPRLLKECSGALDLVKKVSGGELSEETLLCAVDEVDNGQAPLQVAERLVTSVLKSGGVS